MLGCVKRRRLFFAICGNCINFEKAASQYPLPESHLRPTILRLTWYQPVSAVIQDIIGAGGLGSIPGLIKSEAVLPLLRRFFEAVLIRRSDDRVLRASASGAVYSGLNLFGVKPKT